MFEAEAAPTKRVRKSTPKVRSGCITCKARRVKCDEQKPECQRCLRASKNCEGYPDQARATTAQPLPLEPASITTYSIPFKVPGSQADRQLLHYYCCQAAWNLSSCADPTLWTELILRRANHQAVIRNALVALSSLHKDYLCGELAEIDCETSATYTAIQPVANLKTMGMISRCHRQLRYYLSRTDAAPDVALVCSVIFYTFESLLGESQRAIWHLDQGLILLRKCQLDKSFDLDDMLIPHLSTLLHHLDLQASCFDDRRPPVLRLTTDAETQGHVDIVPDTFLDLAHAEAVLTKLQNWVLHHLVTYVHYRGVTVEELPCKPLLERLVLARQFQKFESVLDRFSSYESLVSNASNYKRWENQRQQRAQRLQLLRVNLHAFSHLTKENIPLRTAGAYDIASKAMALLPGHSRRDLAKVMPPHAGSELDLESALAAVEALFSQPAPGSPGASQLGTSTNAARTYTLSTHLIGTLYFLSLKTTNKQILKRATSLFSHPQLHHARDGLWDARTAAFLVDVLVKVRQKGQVTEGCDASDIILHVCDQIAGIDIVGLQRISSMSEKTGLPMMQSKKFTLVLWNGAPRANEEVGKADCCSSPTIGRYVRSSLPGQTVGAGTRSVSRFAQLPGPRGAILVKDTSSGRQGPAVLGVHLQETDKVHPDYVATQACKLARCTLCEPGTHRGEVHPTISSAPPSRPRPRK